MDSKNQTLLIIALILGASIGYLWYKKAPVTRSIDDTLLVGTNVEFQPFSFLENNEIAGFDIDIAKEIAQRLQKKIEFKSMAFEALVPELQLGRIHLIAAGMTATPERGERVLFAKPHLSGDPLVIITLTPAPALKTLEDLKDKTVAVNQGYSADSFISSHPEINNIHRISSDAISAGFLVLQSGRADAFIAAKNSVMPYFNKYGTSTFKFDEIPGTNENASIAVSKKYPELLTQVQKALDEMESDGTIATLKQKWGLS